MRLGTTFLAISAALAAAGMLGPMPAPAAGAPEQITWFSGQSGEVLDPFRVPQAIAAPGALIAGADLSADLGAPLWLGGTLSLGPFAAGSAGPGAIDFMLGDPDIDSIMATGYVAGQVFGLTPYVGAGLGAAPGAAGNPLGLATSSQDLRWAIAYQGVAGFSYSITPWMSTGFEYRYFATIDDLAAVPGARATDPYESHDLMLRLQLGF